MIKKLLSIIFLINLLSCSLIKSEDETVLRLAFVDISGEISDTQKLALDLLKLSQDDSIAGIILLVNSPGGGAAIASAVHDLILNIKNIKPIITVVMGQCFSAAYLIASATHWIIAPEMADIGSIGTILSITKYKKPKLKGELHAGLKQIIISGGKNKAITSPFTKLTEEGLTTLKNMVNESYEYFCNQVATNRNLDPKTAREWADAQIFSGITAKKKGLIDQTGSIAEAEETMKSMILNKRNNTRSNTIPKIKFDRIFIEQENQENPKAEKEFCKLQILYV